MKIFVSMIALVLSASFVACQKQQTDEERRAEVDQQVQERLAAEHQQQQAQELTQREADLRAREQALKDNRDAAASAAAATPLPQAPIARQEESEHDVGGSYEVFYTKLEPYGDWIETDQYGYVYHPRAAENNRWRPYTNGQWTYTDAGWTWVSDEPFGWATYHYGRWTRIRGAGWVWVPGNEWAAAWVSWRKGGQYVGWAPLPPEARFDRASGIRNWSDSYYDVGPDQYVFVSIPDLGEQRIERAIVPAQQNVTIVNQTTNVTNISYNNTIIVNQGPSYDELRGQSRTPIQRLRLQRETGVPGENVRAVVRGDVVTIPAPVVAQARAAERPRAVKRTITQVATDRGWDAVASGKETEQARAKMKAEATPPPNAPQKKFVKPATAPARPLTPNAPVATAPPQKVAPPPPAARSQTNPATTPPPTKPVAPRPHLTPLPSTTPQPTAVSQPALTATTAPLPPARSVATATPAISPSPSVASQPPESSPPPPTASIAARPGEPNGPHRGGKPRQIPRRPKPGEPAATPSATPQ